MSNFQKLHSQGSLDNSRLSQSSLLKKYQPKTTSQDMINQPTADQPKFSSQRNLEQSSLLQKYNPNPAPQPFQRAQSIDPNVLSTKSSSQRSLENSKLLRKYMPQGSQEMDQPPNPATERQGTPARSSSQSRLESSKLLQKYTQKNSSQEFSGLAVRESTPITSFSSEGSLGPSRFTTHNSLLSRYTPRFGQASLDSGKPKQEEDSSRRYSQEYTPEPEVMEFSAMEHYEPGYTRRNSGNVPNRRSSHFAEYEPPTKKIEVEQENIPPQPDVIPHVIKETTPVSVPITVLKRESTPIAQSIFAPIKTEELASVSVPTVPIPVTIETPVAVEQEKPMRKKDKKKEKAKLEAAAATTTISATAAAAAAAAAKNEEALFSSRNRLDHYGSASNPVQAKKTLEVPNMSDFSSRTSMEEFKIAPTNFEEKPTLLSEGSDRQELSAFSKPSKRDVVKQPLLSGLAPVIAATIPMASTAVEAAVVAEENIENIPKDRKLKKRDFTYHPTFTPKDKPEEAKKPVLEKSKSEDHAPTEDLGSHRSLDQYRIGALKQRASSVTRTRPSSQHNSQSGLDRGSTLPASIKYDSQKSLDKQATVPSPAQSKILQKKYAQRSESTDNAPTSIEGKQDFRTSQRSLDQIRLQHSALLQKYVPKTGLSKQEIEVNKTKTESQTSLDKNRIEKSALLSRYRPKDTSVERSPAIETPAPIITDNERRKSPIIFKNQNKNERINSVRDHEYEPIGEPVDTKVEKKDDKKTLRVPTDDADNISMDQLQKDIEDRYFNMPPTVESEASGAEAIGVEEKQSKMKAFMSRAQESGKNLQQKMSTQGKAFKEGGKNFQHKMGTQADKLKTKMSTMSTQVKEKFHKEKEEKEENVEEDKENVEQEATQVAAETPEAPETPIEETEEGTSEPKKKKFKAPDFKKLNLTMPKMHKPDFKRPEFTKNLKTKMQNIKTPDIPKLKKPEMPKFLTEKPHFKTPDFSKIKMPEKFASLKLHRSKSMKESSADGETASATTPETPTEPSTKTTKKKLNLDFSTYPRILKDKFKRQESAPAGNTSIRADTPPLQFSKVAPKPPPKAPFIAKWAEKTSEAESGSYQQYAESELEMERESSVERRMRVHLQAANEFDAPMTPEQKQLDDYDKENREIHLLSQARHDEFVRRKAPMERQESDLASEEEKQFWASALGQKIRQNIDNNSNDLDYLDEEEKPEDSNHLQVPEEKYNMDSSEISEKDYDMRSNTPYTNQECHSSGSSSARRRKGVLEEIDDDEFFLRKRGISEDNIQIGEYISSAIKEGLTTPVNALAQMGHFESYYDDDLDNSERIDISERGSRQRFYNQSFESDELSHEIQSRPRYDDFFKTFPPDRPVRKGKKDYKDDEQDMEYDEEEMRYYESERMKALEHPDVMNEDLSVGDEEGRIIQRIAVPPTPPRRRKKRYRDITPIDEPGFANGFQGRSVSNSFIPNANVENQVFRIEIDQKVPLAQAETFTTPAPTPRRSRSRSQISRLMDDDRTSRGAESFIFDNTHDQKFVVEMSEDHGYAVVKKESTKPAAPVRRKKSTRSLGERPYQTLPHFKHEEPVRPIRNYSTISPNRPPRRRSISDKPTSTQDVTQYEEIDDIENVVHKSLQSGDIVSKMKGRPLPPPPRPPRDSRSKSKSKRPDEDDHDFGGGAGAVVTDNLDQIVEVEVSTQTDPMLDDFEEYDAEVAETTSKPTKTLQEMLKEEQEAEIERARQLADAENLSRSIQKFRETSQKSFSERSRASRSPYGSRPETPAAILIERKVSTPTFQGKEETITKATLTVQPLEPEQTDEEFFDEKFDDDNYIAEIVRKYVRDDKSVEKEESKPVVEEVKVESLKVKEPEVVDEIVIETVAEEEAIKMEEISGIEIEMPQRLHEADKEPSPVPPAVVKEPSPIPEVIKEPSPVPELVKEPSPVPEPIKESSPCPEVVKEPTPELVAKKAPPPPPVEHVSKKAAPLPPVQHEPVVKKQAPAPPSPVVELEPLVMNEEIFLETVSKQLASAPTIPEQIIAVEEPSIESRMIDIESMIIPQKEPTEEESTPIAPPRRKSSGFETAQAANQVASREPQTISIPEMPEPIVRGHLHLASLEIDSLSVNSLQASKINVSEVETTTINTQSIDTSRMTPEPPRGVEIPPGLIEEIVERLRTSEQLLREEIEEKRRREKEEKEKEKQREIEREERERQRELERFERENQRELEILEREKQRELERLTREMQRELEREQEKARRIEKEASSRAAKVEEAIDHENATPLQAAEQTKEEAPVRPPLPQIPPQVQLPPFIYPEYLPFTVPPQTYFQMRNLSDEEGMVPQAPHRRRRQTRTKKDSTSEEDFQREQRARSRHGTRSPEPSIGALSGQLMRACGQMARQTGNDLMGMLRASSKDENKRDLHIALVILIVIVAGLMAMGMSAEKAVHHHHWDYFNPPGNGQK